MRVHLDHTKFRPFLWKMAAVISFSGLNSALRRENGATPPPSSKRAKAQHTNDTQSIKSGNYLLCVLSLTNADRSNLNTKPTSSSFAFSKTTPAPASWTILCRAPGNVKRRRQTQVTTSQRAVAAAMPEKTARARN